jgi:D-3-phosphoglycerate dehydrogenase
MARFRVVMIDYDYDSIEPIGRPIREAGGEFEGRRCKTLDEALAFARGADGLIIQYLGPASDRMFTELPALKVVARMGIGLDPIDVASATRHGVCVVHVPSYCEDEVSDHALALLLSCARRTVLFTNAVRRGTWDFKMGRPIPRLRGRTLGLMGFGKIPRALAPKAMAFGMRVIATDPYLKPEAARKEGVELVDFDTLLAQSDFLSVHCPMTNETRNLFNAETFRKMKRTAILINTARGGIVDTQALARAIQAGELAGAGLDVLPKEPPDRDDPLLRLEQVVLTPHAGYYSDESLVDLQTKAGLYTAQVLCGKRPDGLANPQVIPTARARIQG